MNIVFKCYHEALPTETGNQIAEKVRAYNLTYDDNRPLMRRILEFPYILRRLLRYIMSGQFLIFFLRNIYFIRLVFGAIFYLILPIDLLPEGVVGFIGYIDDLLLIVLFASYIVSVVGVQYIRQHH